jgi:uncharacterized OsmC-like protein
MYTIETIYEGDLVSRATHVRSGVAIVTDAPPDNQGKGSSFSPSDLLAASLGSCMLTIMGIAARTHGFNIEGTRVHIVKKMASDPRRVSGIDVIMDLPPFPYTENHRRIMEHAAKTCPVALSLHPDIKQEVIFNYGASA